MAMLVALFGGLTAAVGIFGLVQPRGFIEFARRLWRTPYAIHIGIGVRLVFGVLLLAVASRSRLPMTLRVLGCLSILGAALIPVMGHERIDRILQWWLAKPPALVRTLGVVVFAFGVFLIEAVS